MANEKYKKAKELREQSIDMMRNNIDALSTLNDSLREFYDLMRWHDLETTFEEYDALFQNIVYEYEDEDIEEHFGIVVKFMQKVLEKEGRN